MRQSNLYEFLGDLEEALRQEIFKETGSEDTTETQCDEDEYIPEEEVVEPLMTPIENMIDKFIKYCTAKSTIPTLEQAQAIHILDSTNSKYQK